MEQYFYMIFNNFDTTPTSCWNILILPALEVENNTRTYAWFLPSDSHASIRPT